MRIGSNGQEITSSGQPSVAENQQETEVVKELREKKRKRIAKDTAESLREEADYLDDVRQYSKILHAFGSIFGIVGETLAIAGGIMTITTKRSTTPLLLIGLGFGAAAASTNLITNWLEEKIESISIKKFERILNETLDCQNEMNIIQLSLAWKEKVRLLFTCILPLPILGFPDLAKDILHEVTSHYVGFPVAVAKAGGEILRHAVTQANRESGWQGSTQDAIQSYTSSRAGGIHIAPVIIVASAMSMVWDIIELRFTVRDIVKNKRSDASKCLRRRADELEEAGPSYWTNKDLMRKRERWR